MRKSLAKVWLFTPRCMAIEDCCEEKQSGHAFHEEARSTTIPSSLKRKLYYYIIILLLYYCISPRSRPTKADYNSFESFGGLYEYRGYGECHLARLSFSLLLITCPVTRDVLSSLNVLNRSALIGYGTRTVTDAALRCSIFCS